MCVASVAADGTPSARMVLLKQVDRRGFVFYTNYRSQKGEELAGRPRAALVWRWFPLERQVRVRRRRRAGRSLEESDAYFASRPRGAQIGAWASPQSQVLVRPGGAGGPGGRDRELVSGTVPFLARRGGVGYGSCPKRWNSGRAGPAGFMTGCGTAASTVASGWAVERLAP